MKADPSRGGGSTLSPAYSAALEALAKKRNEKKSGVGDAVLGGLKSAFGLGISPLATVTDIAAKPFELIPGVPDFNPEDAGSVNLFVQGGKSLQHVTGDVKELGRSIFTGEDTLSESPSARAYQAAGGGLEGTLMAIAPYLDVGSVVAPMAMGAGRGVGMIAPKPVPYTPLTVGQVNATRPMTPYRTTRNALAEDMAQTTPKSADFFAQQGMDKTASPTVNWNAVNLAKEQDIQQFLMNPLDEMLLSPEMQTKLAAQRAFRAEILPFVRRSFLSEKFASINPEQGALSKVAELTPLSTLFEAVPGLKSLYVDTMRSYGIGDVYAPRKVVSGRVAPGFITSEPVLVGNFGKLPSGATIELATPEQSVAFVAERGSLDQVPTEHLRQAIVENSGPNKRYEIIGSGGGVHGMERFLDTATDQYLGLKYTSGTDGFARNVLGEGQDRIRFTGGRAYDYQQLSSPFRETMANEVGVSLGIPDMGTRTMANADGSPFLVTELAQSVYGKDVRDTFLAVAKSPDGTPAIANRVTVDSRIRKALLDDLIENRDAHQGNQLFHVDDDGTVSIIPIDLEQTFDAIEEAALLNRPNSRMLSLDWDKWSHVRYPEAANWSMRNKMSSNPTGLRNEIIGVIEDVQEKFFLDDLFRRLNARRDETLRAFQNASGVSADVLEKYAGYFLQTTEDRFNLFQARMQKFLDTPASEIADAYMTALQKGIDEAS